MLAGSKNTCTCTTILGPVSIFLTLHKPLWFIEISLIALGLVQCTCNVKDAFIHVNCQGRI